MIYSFQEITDRVRPVAEKYGLRSVYLFGSYARGDATEDSDVDLLIDYGDYSKSGANRGMFWIGGLYNDFCDVFEKEVDMVTVGGLEQNRGKEVGGRFVEEVEKDKRRLL